MRFESSKSSFILGIIYFSCAVSLGTIYLIIIDDVSLLFKIFMISVMLSATVVPLWVVFATYYIIDGENLFIKSAFMTWSIEVKNIVKIKKTGDALSGPALSFDRIEVTYLSEKNKKKKVLISPEDRDKFLHNIEKAQQKLAA
ncbi:MAG: PH domain-containing protein [Melioribacteraceae bacterium]|nr:PH domain-containing protein [Melioribacteraceae bacterium]MCF8263906.1 PH domain-containing protein [Melioribacteraceae bacterium]MCF8430311.1 PH domain-containing protein [Melioribacteraceae bacterium]